MKISSRTGLLAGTAAAGWSMIPGRVLGANRRVNLAAVGIGAQGGRILQAIGGQPDVNVVALCDVDIHSDAPVLTFDFDRKTKQITNNAKANALLIDDVRNGWEQYYAI